MLVLDGEPREALLDDDAKMVEDGPVCGRPLPFGTLISRCADLKKGVNQ